jgi:hypothetical protein
MNQFLHNEENEVIEDRQDITAIEILKEYVNNAVDEEETELYEMMANDFSEIIDDIDSEFLSEANRASFVALVGYADQIGKSQLLNDWLPEYEKKSELIINQRQNFLHMKNDFDQYIKKCA